MEIQGDRSGAKPWVCTDTDTEGGGTVVRPLVRSDGQRRKGRDSFCLFMIDRKRGGRGKGGLYGRMSKVSREKKGGRGWTE